MTQRQLAERALAQRTTQPNLRPNVPADVLSAITPVLNETIHVGVACAVKLNNGKIQYLTARHLRYPDDDSVPLQLTIDGHVAEVAWECEASDMMLLSIGEENSAHALHLAFEPQQPPEDYDPSESLCSWIVIYRDASYPIPIRNLILSSTTSSRGRVFTICFDTFEEKDFKLLSEGASGSPILDENHSVVAIYRRTGEAGKPLGTSIVHLRESRHGLQAKPVKSTTSALLKRIRNREFYYIGKRRRQCAVVGAILLAMMCGAVVATFMLELHKRIVVGMPLSVLFIMGVGKLLLVLLNIRDCERDADALLYIYRYKGKEQLADSILNSKCRQLRRLVLDELTRI